MINPAVSSRCPDWTPALKHLSGVDPVLSRIIQRVGPCTMAPRGDYFWALCQSIINQQISVAAGRTISKRFCALFPRKRPTPRGLLLLDEKTLRGAGLSRQKASYIRGIAQAFDSGQIPSRRLRHMPDEELMEALIALKGVGRWTAEVFAMFVLNRTDMSRWTTSACAAGSSSHTRCGAIRRRSRCANARRRGGRTGVSRPGICGWARMEIPNDEISGNSETRSSNPRIKKKNPNDEFRAFVVRT